MKTERTQDDRRMEGLGFCDKRQYEHAGPHPKIGEIGQMMPPFPCVNWRPVERTKDVRKVQPVASTKPALPTETPNSGNQPITVPQISVPSPLSAQSDEGLARVIELLASAKRALAPHAGSSMQSPDPEWPRGVMNCVLLAKEKLLSLAAANNQRDLSIQEAARLIQDFETVQYNDGTLENVLSRVAAANKEKEDEDTKRLDWLELPGSMPKMTRAMVAITSERKGKGPACLWREAIDQARRGTGDVRSIGLHDAETQNR